MTCVSLCVSISSPFPCSWTVLWCTECRQVWCDTQNFCVHKIAAVFIFIISLCLSLCLSVSLFYFLYTVLSQETAASLISLTVQTFFLTCRLWRTSNFYFQQLFHKVPDYQTSMVDNCYSVIYLWWDMSYGKFGNKRQNLSQRSYNLLGLHAIPEDVDETEC